MNRRTFLAAAAAGLLQCAPVPRASAENAAPAERPNIIFIMTDDQGPWAWGPGGHPDARTPNMDRIRREGALLQEYFVTCPVCSPARASLMTSRYPLELGIPDYLRESDPERGLDQGVPVWPRLLQDAGYRTALIGKWHLGMQDRHLPRHFGYDEFKGFRVGPGISKDPVVEIDGVQTRMPGWTPDVLTNLAIDFVQRAHPQPFLLSLHYWAPHANTDTMTETGDRTWLPLSEADFVPFRDRDITLPEPQHPELDVPRAQRMSREYLASVASADRNIGRLLEVLDEMNLAENTIVVFTSDHGYNLAHHGIWHKGNGRWLLKDRQDHRPNLWDNSLRAPAAVRWPARIAAGVTVSHTTSNLDWFPTLLAMADVPLPAGAEVRGASVLPLLLDAQEPWNRSDDFFVQYDQWPDIDKSANMRAYRTREWKLLRDFRNPGKDELYHLAQDPGEERNLIDAQDARTQLIRKAMESLLRRAMEQVNDPALR